MDNNLISIIIPVYNTPIDYFKRCLDSIIEQKYKDFEIIVIDDGSRQEEHCLYQNLCSMDSRIRIYRQDNQGVSAARNYGISLAKGSYVTFVDADDVVDQNFLQDSAVIAQKSGADFVIGAIQYIPGDKIGQGSDKETFVGKEKITDLKRAFMQLPQSTFQYPILGTPCARLYAVRCLEGVRFPVGVTHWEDQIFNRLFLNNISTAVVSPNCWYYYYQNDFSAMHQNFDSKYIDNSKPFWKIWNELNLQEDEETAIDVQFRSIDFFCSAVNLNIIPLKIEWKQKKSMMESLLKEEIFQQVIKTLRYNNVKKKKDFLRLYCLKNNKMGLLYLFIKMKKTVKA